MLNDRVIFVAGGAGNVGSFIVKKFLELNAIVLTSTRDKSKYEKLVNLVGDIIGNNDKLKIFKLDIADESINYKVIEYIDKVYKRLDAVVVSLGSWFDEKKILNLETDFLLKVYKERFITHFIISKLFLNYMVKVGYGCYVSLAGYHAEEPLENYGHISISGASQLMLTKVLSKELRDYKKITVNTILMPALNAKIKGDDLATYLANFINFNLDTPLIKGQIIKLEQSIF